LATVRYQLAQAEAVGAAFRRRMARPALWGFEALLVLVALGLALAGPSASAYAIIFLVIAVAQPFLMYAALSAAVGRVPWLTAPTTLEFDDAGIRMSMGDVANEMRWSVFARWTRTREHFFLYPGAGPNAITIPLRAFDDATLADFTRHLERIPRTAP
jgi:hypothetical protein